MRVQSRIRWAQALEMTEPDLEEEIRRIEAAEDFQILKDFGVLKLNPYSEARWAARRFAGRELRPPDSELPEILNGRGDLARIIQRIGQKRFEECFLKDDFLTDEARAKISALSMDEVRKIREFIDDLYIRSEFSSASLSADAPRKTYSVVAGILVENGRPALAFFSREIWKGRYSIDALKKSEFLANLPREKADGLSRFLSRLGLIERRKTALYRILEVLMEMQAEYLASGDLEKRRPLTQRAVAAQINSSPSAVNALISNKALELPWGLEAPMKSLMPSPKAVLLGKLHDLAAEFPGRSDRELAQSLGSLYGANLSRRSVAQYRKELKISCF